MIRTKKFIEQENIRRKKYLKNNPWINHYRNAKARCNFKYATGYKFYGNRGIKFKMTIEAFKKLWFRDKAYLLKHPSIDRINPDGNYELYNCRFIEALENGRRIENRSQTKPVIQKTLDDKTINIFKSLSEAGRKTGIDFRMISRCAIGLRNKTGGFKWEYDKKEKK